MRVKMPPSMRIVADTRPSDQGMMLLHREICCLSHTESEDDRDDETAWSTCGVCHRHFHPAAISRMLRRHALSSPPALTRHDHRQSGLGSLSCDTTVANGRPSSDSPAESMTQSSPGSACAQKSSEKRVRSPEPSTYTCFTCGDTFASAWNLVQHAQHQHKLAICALPEVNGDSSNDQVCSSPDPAAAATVPFYSGSTDSNALPHRCQTASPSREQRPRTPSSPVSRLALTGVLPESNRLELPFFGARTCGRSFPGLLDAAAIGSRAAVANNFSMESIMSEQFRLHPHLPLIPFAERGPFDLTLRSRSGVGLSAIESVDFYSQRLRQLATAGPPLSAPDTTTDVHIQPSLSPVQTSLGNWRTQTSLSNNQQSIQQPYSKPVLPFVAGKTTTKTARKERPRACEYCHKVFRFQSNLIVHRRIHTGEKPYKCKICSHACTQSSKLKRHMKTHMNSSESAVEKNTQASDDVKEDEDSSLQGDEEDEEPMDDEEYDSLEMGEADGPEDLSVKSVCSESASAQTEHASIPTPASDKSSLVDELMNKFGLSNINAYREAYTQALKESANEDSRNNSDNEASLSEPSDEETRDSSKENASDTALFDDKNGIRVRSHFRAAPSVLDLSRANVLDSLKLTYAPRIGPGVVDNDSKAGILPAIWQQDSGIVRELQYPPITTSDYLSNSKTIVEASAKQFCSIPGRQSLALRTFAQTVSVDRGSTTPSPQQTTKRDKNESRRRDTCEFCGKVFKNCSNLTVHRRSHTGEKPYHCTMCNYACAQSSKLTRHMKTHGRIGKDVYQCRFCNMPFSVASTLEKHMRKCVVSQNGKTTALPPVLPGH